jgi:Flp pilus assembly protein TadD
MTRLLCTTAVAALCAAWIVATPVWADDDNAVAPAAATTDAPAADAQPKTLQDAINIQIAVAKAQRQQGQVDEAAKAFAQLMLVAPDNPTVLGEYGKALAQQGHSQDAVILLAHAVQIQTGDWTYYSALGVAYDQLGKRKEAREAYDRALALKPGEPSVLNNYALSRMLAGDYAGAQKMFEQVQASGSNDPKVAANLAKLAGLQAGHPQKTSVPDTAIAKPFTPEPHTPVVVATLPKPVAAPKGGVMMEKVPVDPLAGPVGKAHAPVMAIATPQATHAPASLAAVSKPVVQAPVSVKPAIVVAEKINPATTMMQKVPADPLAGPVTPRSVAAVTPKKPVAKIAPTPKVLAAAKPAAAAEKPKTVLAKATTLSAPPALRTASDSN